MKKTFDTDKTLSSLNQVLFLFFLYIYPFKKKSGECFQIPFLSPVRAASLDI